MSLAFADPLLHNTTPYGARCSGKTIVVLSLLIGLGIVTLMMGGQQSMPEEPNTNMALQPLQSARVPQFTQAASAKFVQPGQAWRSLQPTRAAWQFRKPAVAASSDDAHAVAANPMFVGGRRAALASGLLAAVTLPNAALAESAEDAELRKTLATKRKDGGGGVTSNAARGGGGGRFNVESFDMDRGAEIVQEQLEKQKTKKKLKNRFAEKTKEEVAEEESGKLTPVYATLGLVGLSVPFYFANLQRLGTKVASGGRDDGYGRQTAGGRKTVKGKGKTTAKKGFFR